MKTYRQQIQADSLKTMVEVKSLVLGIAYDLRYATDNNFTHRKLYATPIHTFLRLPVARALANVQHELLAKGLSLKIFDAYRPYSVTQKMWELIHDERYVADPAKGSGHNRGLAVDLTIVDQKTGQDLNMGTGFDNFTDSAHHAFKNLSPLVLRNRILLRQTMEKYGFTALETEWWHYSWPNNRDYEVLDLNFRKLTKHD